MQDLCDESAMTSKRTHIVRRRTALSARVMWTGMLLACFAWLIHASPFLATLWDSSIDDVDNQHHTHLSHNLHVELAPIISAVEQYERIKADIAQTNRTSPHDSAAHQLYFYDTFTSESPSTVADTESRAIDVTVAPATSPNLQHQVSIQSSESNNGHHSRCSICTTMSAALLPTLIKLNKPSLIEPITTIMAIRSDEASSYVASFVRPLSRAPPPILQT